MFSDPKKNDKPWIHQIGGLLCTPTGANCTGVTQPEATGVPTSLPKPLRATSAAGRWVYHHSMGISYQYILFETIHVIAIICLRFYVYTVRIYIYIYI